MPLFKVKARDHSVELIVRARCLSCARQAAVESSPANEVMLWRDPNLSKVELIFDTNQLPHEQMGKRCVLERIEL